MAQQAGTPAREAHTLADFEHHVRGRRECWGGPADYLVAGCGILVPISSRDALSRLAADPALRLALGRAGRERIEREFDWEIKVDRMLEIYRRVRGAAKVLATAGGH